MNDRSATLSLDAQSQIAELLELLAGCERATLGRPCPGREQLGDGTLAAVCAHVAFNYGRIAAFVAAQSSPSTTAPPPPPRRPGGRWLASLLGGRGHRGDHGPRMHAAEGSAPEIDRAGLIEQMTSAQVALRVLEELGDRQLDAVPPVDEAMRFCDGERTLEQIVAALLKHQGHQLHALRAGFLAASPARWSEPGGDSLSGR